MKHQQVNAFMQALLDYHLDPQALKKSVKSEALSLSEKKVIKAWSVLASNDFEEIFSLLNSLPTSSDPLLDSQKKLILGIAWNNKCECDQAIPLLEESIALLLKYELPRHLFIAHYNLFIAYLNQKNASGMRMCLEELKRIGAHTERAEISLIQAQYKYFAFIHDLENAKLMLNQAAARFSEMSDSQIIEQWIDEYTFGVKGKDFEASRRALDQMKKHRKFRLSANYQYMKMLLENFIGEAPLYVYDSDFKDYPILQHQLNVIRYLEEKDEKSAAISWQALNHIAPAVYQPNFNYQGDVCIFSLCLLKHLEKNKVNEFVNVALPEGFEERVIFLLKNSSTPIRKDILFKLVWQREMSEKNDSLKLSKTIHRIKEKIDADIRYHKGCYQWINAPESKKTGII